MPWAVKGDYPEVYGTDEKLHVVFCAGINPAFRETTPLHLVFHFFCGGVKAGAVGGGSKKINGTVWGRCGIVAFGCGGTLFPVPDTVQLLSCLAVGSSLLPRLADMVRRPLDQGNILTLTNRNDSATYAREAQVGGLLRRAGL